VHKVKLGRGRRVFISFIKFRFGHGLGTKKLSAAVKTKRRMKFMGKLFRGPSQHAIASTTTIVIPLVMQCSLFQPHLLD
jgi:hypothetical protein